MESRLPQMPIECEEIVNPTNSVGLYPASIPLGQDLPQDIVVLPMSDHNSRHTPCEVKRRKNLGSDLPLST